MGAQFATTSAATSCTRLRPSLVELRQVLGLQLTGLLASIDRCEAKHRDDQEAEHQPTSSTAGNVPRPT